MEQRQRKQTKIENPKENESKTQVSLINQSFVYYKLLIFSIMVVLVPLIVFFYTKEIGLTFAGIMAAISANVVLFAYVAVAFLESE
jgi:vacuolar ATPase assembly integral membrane protein VMA21